MCSGTRDMRGVPRDVEKYLKLNGAGNLMKLMVEGAGEYL